MHMYISIIWGGIGYDYTAYVDLDVSEKLLNLITHPLVSRVLYNFGKDWVMHV